MHGHSHGHSHGPNPGHDHDHDTHDQHAIADASTQTAFKISVLMNLALVLTEAGVGFFVGSMALVADAGHNAGDVLGLALAWGAARLAARRPTRKHTYGMARSTILAALLNAALLLVACGALIWESIHRLGQPHQVPGVTVAVVAAIAILINAGSAALFFRVQHGDVNARGAFLHMVADAAVSVVVLASGVVVALTGWTFIDPLAGIAVAGAIVWSGWGLLRESLELALDAVPRGIDLAAIEEALRTLPGVKSVHDLHVWPLSTTITALTAHLEHDGTRDTDDLLRDGQHRLAERFGIRHTTLQFENSACEQSCHD